jgi:hypothetical protein
MASFGLLRFVDSPEACLGPAALPMAGLSFPDGVPARLMLKMVIAAADDDVAFSPDNLRASQKAGRLKTLLNHGRMQGAMPNIADIASEKHPSFAPVRTIIVVYLANRATAYDAALAARRGTIDCGPIAPVGIITHPVWWIGHHQVGIGPVKQPTNIFRRCRIADQQPMPPQGPQIVTDGHGIDGWLRHLVRVRSAHGLRVED